MIPRSLVFRGRGLAHRSAFNARSGLFPPTLVSSQQLRAFRRALATEADVAIPKTQLVALAHQQPGPVEFVEDYPVPQLKRGEVLAKVLYTGVCQSDLHTVRGTAAGADGKNITDIKFPHVGGHEAVARVVKIGEGVHGVKTGSLVGVRFISRICRRCEFCLAGQEQHCKGGMTNHLHHEDGAFQQYIALDADNLTMLPDDIDPVEMGPILCAGITAYKCVQSCDFKPGEWLVVIGAAGGMGHLAVQYAKVKGARVIAIDSGSHKKDYCLGLGARHYIDARAGNSLDEVLRLTDGGAHAVVCAAGSPKAYANAADMLRIGGTLACGGIPPGTPQLETSIGKIVIKGLRIVGCLVGSLKETMEVVELTRQGLVKPTIKLKDFRDIPQIYEELERGDVIGRTVIKVVQDE